jgi:excisionase family DNA binding protein
MFPVDQVEPRFLKLDDVAAELAISWSQTYALVRSGELAAIKIGGRGQWRVERAALEEYIARCYEETRAFVATHPAGLEQDGQHES